MTPISAPFVLLDDSRASGVAGQSLLFADPRRIICARTIDEVPAALAEIDEAVAAGLHVAGWIAYEAAAAFEPKVKAAIHHWPYEPLVWMMVTDSVQTLSRQETECWIETQCQGAESNLILQDGGLDQPAYEQTVHRVQDYINAGDIYQANFTFPRKGRVVGDALDLYRKLRHSQPVEYGAFIDTGDEKILSLSPELFVRRHGNALAARPMKGTAARRATAEQDKQAIVSLAADQKSRAENLMIVDLIRNDLSRFAKPGSVKVSDLFTVETYPTLHQMTSGVEAECEPDLPPSRLLQALFPCGSVTGAPKIRAMEVISELEQGARGVYCGGVGYFSSAQPKKPAKWALSVPIRTFVVIKDDTCRLGIGSGIVADSDAAAEYEECLLKASFAETVAEEAFYLIETMRCEAGRVELLARHMDRLSGSAAALGIPVDRTSVATKVTNALPSHGVHRVRLTLAADGKASVAVTAFSEGQEDILEVAIAEERVTSSAVWLQHKSSQRALYNKASKVAAANGLADILFVNERGELAEGAISNLFLELHGELVTPPLASGVLPGVLRAALLDGKSRRVSERVLHYSDLKQATALYIGNALRGLRRVHLRPDPVNVSDLSDSLSSH